MYVRVFLHDLSSNAINIALGQKEHVETGNENTRVVLQHLIWFVLER
jgi:hypothetical protein